MRLHRSTAGADSQSAPYNATLPSSLFWDLSQAIGKIAAVILAIVILLIISQRSWRLKNAVDAILPDTIVRKIFPDRPASALSPASTGLARFFGTLPPSQSASTFHAGSTEEQVVAIQGKPDRTTGTTWFYGSSEVRFVDGKVVGWRSDPASPLKAR